MIHKNKVIEMGLLLLVPITWFYPVLGNPHIVIGSPISDLWNGIWSLWWMTDQISSGLGICSDQFNYPKGGCIVPSDWTGVVGMLLMRVFFEPLQAFTVTLWLQVGVIGIGMSTLFKTLYSDDSNTLNLRAVTAGAMLQLSTVVNTGLHNGSTEVLSLGWVLLGISGTLKAIKGESRQWLWVLPVVLTSWYGVLGFGIFVCGILLVMRPSWRVWLPHLGGIGLCWIFFAFWVLQESTGQGNLLFIKSMTEMDSVRRTIGSADPWTYVMPWSYRSPDFSEVSKFGEQFVHSAYLGWGVLVGLFWGIRSQKWLLWVALVGFALSLGPVLVIQSEPWLWNDRLGVPLPFFLLERVPFFSSLTLLYRLSWVPIVALILLTTHHVSTRFLGVWGFVVIAEWCWLSPNRDLPSCSDASLVMQLEQLKTFPNGAVAHYPLVGGRPHMLSTLLHQNPIVGTLNFPSNVTMTGFMKQIDLIETPDNQIFLERVAQAARQKGIRYWVIDENSEVMPDSHWQTVERVRTTFPIVLSLESTDTICSSGWQRLHVVQLW